ncbi:MAG: phage portal protein [Oscillibacter sp.]
MGVLDNMIAAFSPRRAYERELWRQGLESVRGYDAAGSGRLNAGWRVSNESAEITDRNSRDVVRARARDLERNSDIAQSVIHAYRRNVVGKGYTVQAKTGNDATDKLIEKTWKQWCKARNCDVTGEQSFSEILRMASDRKKVDGGMLIIYRYTTGGVAPFKLQAMEVDELDITRTAPRTPGNRVVGGIEYNKYRRPVGYWIRQYDIEGWQLLDPVYIDGKDVYFYKTKRRPSQLREMSDMSPTITRIRDTNEFIAAVSVKERIAACLSVLIKKNLPTGGVGRTGYKQEGGQVEYAGKKLGPGMIMEMNAGDEAQVVDPKGAATDATAFLKTQQGLIGAGQGLSYEAVSRDMSGATYSSARQNAIEDENTYAEDIEMLTDLMSEVYENFVISGYLTGLFIMPDFWERKADYLDHTWVKAPKKWIDPLKESSADKVALMTGQKTYKDICAEKGKDWKEAINDMAEVLEYGRQCGIEMGGVLFGSGTTAAQQNATATEPAAEPADE